MLMTMEIFELGERSVVDANKFSMHRFTGTDEVEPEKSLKQLGYVLMSEMKMKIIHQKILDILEAQD